MGGSNPGISCTPGTDPARPLITDFSDWDATAGKWGMLGNLRGSKFSYNDGRASTMTVTVESASMLFSGTVSPMAGEDGGPGMGGYAGGGMSFDACVNTTLYSGIKFTLGGSTAGCDLSFQIQTYSQQATSNRGGCDSSISGNCYHFPQATVPFAAGSTTVTFAQLEGTGMPTTAAAFKAEMVGLQWQFQSAAGVDGGLQVDCTGIAMTVDDVELVP
jgi:hypothetical protein